MTAERELDALVAEKVMGWTHNGDRITRPDGSSFDGPEMNMPDDDLYGRYSYPAYSTSIAAAWTVVEKFKGEVKLVTLARGGWYCRIEQHESSVLRPMAHFVEEKADTAPLAICLAALKAVGTKEGVTA